jgi:hypothetical protein
VERCLNQYTVGKEDAGNPAVFYRRGFARRLAPVPGGGLVCVLSELRAGIEANLLAVSERPDPDLLGKTQPKLRYLASLKEEDWPREPHPIPYLRLPTGEAFDRTKRPGPTLTDACDGQFGIFLFEPSIRQVIALSPDRFLVALFGDRESRTSEQYGLLLLSREGEILGRLVLAEGDSPYLDRHVTVCWDAARGRIVYMSKAALYFFGPEGQLLLRLPLASERLKGLQKFHLAAVSPAGGLVFQRPDEHAFLAFDPPDDDAELETRLAEAVAAYPGWRRATRKERQCINKKWVRAAGRPHDGGGRG